MEETGSGERNRREVNATVERHVEIIFILVLMKKLH